MLWQLLSGTLLSFLVLEVLVQGLGHAKPVV